MEPPTSVQKTSHRLGIPPSARIITGAVVTSSSSITRGLVSAKNALTRSNPCARPVWTWLSTTTSITPLTRDFSPASLGHPVGAVANRRGRCVQPPPLHFFYTWKKLASRRRVECRGRADDVRGECHSAFSRGSRVSFTRRSDSVSLRPKQKGHQARGRFPVGLHRPEGSRHCPDP